MLVVVGLGNPGPKYTETRHNLGFMVLDALAARSKVRWKEPRPSFAKAEISLGGHDVVLIKPMTYMNLSGEALADWEHLQGGQVAAKDVLVLTDDMAIPLGMLRLRGKGSDGGHNGLASIAAHLNTTKFARLRLGVGEPPPGIDASDYVLMRFLDEEWEAVARMARAAERCVACWARDGLNTAMNRFNKSVAPKPKEDTNPTPGNDPDPSKAPK